MKLQYLGTAAAEGIPAIFCRCENCRRALRLGGKNERRRSHAIVDDAILIDWNADSYGNFRRFNIDVTGVGTILFTHVHSDHFYPKDFAMRVEPYTHGNDRKLVAYGSADILPALQVKGIEKDDPVYGVEAKAVEPFVPFEADGHRITSLKATHGTADPRTYIIEKDGKAMLYAHDTGLFPEETLAYIASSGVVFDLISLDCTSCYTPMNYSSHMNLERDILMRDKLREMGAVTEKTVCILNHFSHNNMDFSYEEMNKIAQENGFTVSYDGMIVEF